MKQPKTTILLPLTVLLGASLVFGGCSAAKKPLTPTPGTPTTPRATTPAPNTAKQVADRVTAEAKKVKDVQSATAVVSGKNIYLGLGLNPNIEKGKRAEVEKTVLDRVKKIEPNYTVSITSDVDTVARIKKVAQGIAQGKPISSFDREIREIGNRIKPKTK
jgi:YhcN/YlaJ family sporulation lipoprotein